MFVVIVVFFSNLHHQKRGPEHFLLNKTCLLDAFGWWDGSPCDVSEGYLVFGTMPQAAMRHHEGCCYLWILEQIEEVHASQQDHTAALIPPRWVHLLFVTQIHEPLCLRLEGGQTDLFRRSSLWDVVVWFYSRRMLTYFDVTLQACSAKVLKNYQTLHVGDCPGNHNFMDDHTDHTFIFIHVCRCILYPAPDFGTVTAWGVVSDSCFHIYIAQ